jgi:hypothetical protein
MLHGLLALPLGVSQHPATGQLAGLTVEWSMVLTLLSQLAVIGNTTAHQARAFGTHSSLSNSKRIVLKKIVLRMV